MHNLLAKLRAMSAVPSPSSPLSLLKKKLNRDEGDQSEAQKPSASPLCFTAKERDQHAAAQTEILRQLHDELDAAVLEAYGWPAGMEDAEILERLVALNFARAQEEKRGLIRWLRPEYQAPEAAIPLVQPLLEVEEGPKDDEDLDEIR